MRIEIKNLSFAYPFFMQDGRTIFEDVNLTFQHGQLHLITGESGSGKTTLLKLVAGMLQPSSGQILFTPPALKKQVYFLPCVDSLFFIGETVKEELQGSSLSHKLFSDFKLPEDFFDKKINELSDGYRVLLALMIALQSRAKLYLIDDVITVFDKKSIAVFRQVIRNLLTVGHLVIMATNDYDRLIDLSPIFYRIEDTRVYRINQRPKSYSELIYDEIARRTG